MTRLGFDIPVEYINAERFWRRVAKSEEGCWLWQGTRRKTPGAEYGFVTFSVPTPWGKATLWRMAHRVAYALTHGPIPAALEVRHSCDTPPCVRPDHLSTGTTLDNARDKMERDRHPRGGRVPGVFLPRAPLPEHSGEKHYAAKLTEAQVVEMRTRYAGDASVQLNALAREYGVSAPLVKMIVTGRAWKRAGGPRSSIRPIIGAGVSGAKLTAERVADLRARFDAGATIYELGAQFGIAPQTASNIVRGKTWKHVASAATPVLPGHKHLTRQQVTTIRQRKAAGVTQIQLARDYGVSPGTISLLVRGLTHATPPPTPRRVC